MQGLLLLIVCGILVYKKVSEAMHRTWFEFALDSSKQFIGAGCVHLMNLFFAMQLKGITKNGDQCEWYWVNIMVDTTLGTFVEYLLLICLGRMLEHFLDSKGAEEFKGGHYYEYAGHELVFKWGRYAKQLMLWLLVVTLMKISMVALMVIFNEAFEAVAQCVLNPMAARPQLKLAAVMIVTPMCMNAFQFWVVDNFIKKTDEGGSLSSVHP